MSTVGQFKHPGLGRKTFTEFRLSLAVELCRKLSIFSQSVCFRSKLRVEERTVKHFRNAGIDQGFYQPGGVPRSSPTGIVSCVRKNQRGHLRIAGRLFGQFHGFFDGSQFFQKTLTILPAQVRDLTAEILSIFQRTVRSDDDCHSVFGSITENKSPANGNIEDFSTLFLHPSLSIGNHVCIGSFTGQQGETYGGQGQSDECRLRIGPGKDLTERVGCFLTTGYHVHMRIGEIGNQQIRLIHHPRGNIRM